MCLLSTIKTIKREWQNFRAHTYTGTSVATDVRCNSCNMHTYVRVYVHSMVVKNKSFELHRRNLLMKFCAQKLADTLLKVIIKGQIFYAFTFNLTKMKC